MLGSRRILTTLALAAIGFGAMAGDVGPYEATIRKNVGVGLGTRIFGNVGDGLFCQVFAATTNGSCGNQTFAVSTGTLGANTPAKMVRTNLREYMQDNMDSVARDIASGRGEAMDAVLDILAVPVASRAEVAGRLQAQFTAIYDSSAITHEVVAERIASIVLPA